MSKRNGSGEQSGQFLETKKRRTDDDDGPDVDPNDELDWDADDDNDMYLDAMGAEVFDCLFPFDVHGNNIFGIIQGDVKLSIPEHSKKQWCRKPLSPINPKNDTITFQQMDTDYYVAVSRKST
jgi:hypothetical protein